MRSGAPSPRAAISAPSPKIAKASVSSRSVEKSTGRGAAGKGKAAQEVGSTVSVPRSSLSAAAKKGTKKGEKIVDLVEEEAPCTDDEGEAAEEEPAGFVEAPCVSERAAEADAPVEEAEGGEAGGGDAAMSIADAAHSDAHTSGSSAAQSAAACQPVVLGAMATAGLAGKWVGREEETARLMALLGAPGVAVPPILVTGHAATGKVRAHPGGNPGANGWFL